MAKRNKKETINFKEELDKKLHLRSIDDVVNGETADQFICNHERHHYHWYNTAEYQYEYCPTCKHIRSFWFKSFWKRLKSLFKNETL